MRSVSSVSTMPKCLIRSREAGRVRRFTGMPATPSGRWPCLRALLTRPIAPLRVPPKLPRPVPPSRPIRASRSCRSFVRQALQGKRFARASIDRSDPSRSGFGSPANPRARLRPRPRLFSENRYPEQDGFFACCAQRRGGAFCRMSGLSGPASRNFYPIWQEYEKIAFPASCGLDEEARERGSGVSLPERGFGVALLGVRPAGSSCGCGGSFPSLASITEKPVHYRMHGLFQGKLYAYATQRISIWAVRIRRNIVSG